MLTQARLQEVLDYCPETGVFIWRKRKSAKVGSVSNGRLRICVDWKIYRAHRLAWLYTYGEWPKFDVDHIDGNPLNNAIRNLRDVPRSVNMENQRRARSDSKVGLLGVIERDGKYRAEIASHGKRYRFGPFDTAEAAHEAYLAAKRRIHIGCTI